MYSRFSVLKVKHHSKMQTNQESKADRIFNRCFYVFFVTGALYFAAHLVLSIIQKGGGV
jgi:hypothetical protein